MDESTGDQTLPKCKCPQKHINDLATQLNQQQAATQQFNHTQPHPTMPLDTSFPPPLQTINQSQYHSIYQNMSGMNESLLQGLGMMHKSITTQCSVLQDQMRQFLSASKDTISVMQNLVMAKMQRNFGTWLDDLSRLATISGKDQAEVAMAISRGPLHKYINELYFSSLIWASIKPKLQERFSECGSSTMAKHKLTHLTQTDLAIHEYIAKFSDMAEHAYNIRLTDGLKSTLSFTIH